MESIDYLGSSDENLDQQCDRMQSVSYLLKVGRSYSHPERHIGASQCTTAISNNTEITAASVINSTSITGKLLNHIASRVSALVTLAASKQSPNYFVFFFLSLLLDTLKAYQRLKIPLVAKTNEKKKKAKRKLRDLNEVPYNGFKDFILLVVEVFLKNNSNCDNWFLRSRSCCLKVIDIIKLVTADESISKLECNLDISKVLSKCSSLTLLMMDAVNLKINQQSDQFVTESVNCKFINDDVGQDLVIVLITLQITLFNRLLRYESVSSSAALSSSTLSSSFSSSSSTPTASSYVDDNDVNIIQISTIRIGKSLISAISESDMVSIFKALSMNDKELLLSLLDISEVELRLLYNVKLIVPIEIIIKNNDTKNKTICSDCTIKMYSSCRCSGSNESVRCTDTECTNTHSNCCTTNDDNNRDNNNNNNNASNNEDITNDKNNNNNDNFNNNDNYSDGSNTKNKFYYKSQNILEELQVLGCVSLPSFLLFISECISFDATLFCDYLCSPETLALKYILRITKQLLALQPSSTPSSSSSSSYLSSQLPSSSSTSSSSSSYPSSSYPSSSQPPSSSSTFSSSSSVNTSYFPSSTSISSSSSSSLPSSQNSSTLSPFSASSTARNCPELLEISYQTIKIKKKHLTPTSNIPNRPEHSLKINPSLSNTKEDNNSSLEDSSLSIDPYKKPILKYVVAWVSNEKTTVVDEKNDGNMNNIMWGGIEKFEQKVCPLEWVRDKEIVALKTIANVERNNNMNSDNKNNDNNNSKKDNEYDKSNNNIKIVNDNEGDMTENISEALQLYDKTLEFLMSLNTMLISLTNSKKSSSTLPFNSSLLLQRLQEIISFL